MDFLKIVVAALLFFFAGMPRAYAVDSSGQPYNWTCGVVIPLTGAVAEWGSVMRNAVELARADFGYDKVRFLYEDDQFLPKNTVAVVQKLLTVDKVDCLITLGSSTSMSVQDLAERAKVPLFAVALNPRVGQGMSFVFRYYVPISRQVEAISRELPRRNYRRVAFATSTHDATLALRDALLSGQVIRPVAAEEIPTGEADLGAVALRLLKAQPDAIFLNLVPPQPSGLARKLRELGYAGQFFSGPLIESREEIAAAKGALDGTWFVTVNNTRAESFNSEYQKRFNTYPGILSVYAYDIAKLIIQGRREKDFCAYVRSLSTFEGLAGRYGWDGSGFDIPAGVWTISGDVFKQLP